eukprot:2332406-Alexandrium_andersonii.AAC.1
MRTPAPLRHSKYLRAVGDNHSEITPSGARTTRSGVRITPKEACAPLRNHSESFLSLIHISEPTRLALI